VNCSQALRARFWLTEHGRNSIRKVEPLIVRTDVTTMKLIKTIICLVFVSASVVPVYAVTIERNANVAVENNFVVGPAKLEATIAPGESKTVLISVDNKTGRTQDFSVSFEDFVPSGEVDQAVELLGDKTSATSLKNFLTVEKTEFTLEQGDRALVPVRISIPVGAEAKGLFGSIVISAVSQRNTLTDDARAYSGAVVIGRVGALAFVTVEGNTNPAGALQSVKTKNNSSVFLKGDVSLRVAFENTGNVNLNPYGVITLKNMWGSVVETIVLDPWYALPQSVRTRDVEISTGNMFGYYTAVAQVNRGYEDIIDSKQVSFVVIPPFALALIVGSALLITTLIIWRNRVRKASVKNL